MLIPILVQILLTLAVYIALAVAKGRAVRRNEVDLARRALDEDAWPASVRKINNNIRNQFEAPVLFYVVALIHWQLGAPSTLAAAVAWLFVISRIVHAYVHTGPNHVPTRRAVFMFGVACILALVLLAAWRIIAA